MARTRTEHLQRQGRDLAILLVIPLILGVIYYLTPISFQNTLALDHTNPELHTFWTNMLVHHHQPGDTHLLGNLLMYSLLVFPTWQIFATLDNDRKFWIGLGLILTIGAVLASLSSFIAFHEILGLTFENDRGFSGVVGGIAGFLLMSVLETFRQNQTELIAALSISLFVAYLVLGLGLVTGRLPFTGFGILLFGLVAVSTRTRRVASAGELAEWGRDNRPLAIMLVFAVFASTLAFATALPDGIRTGSGGLINIVAHGAGILVGMSVERVLHYGPPTMLQPSSGS